MPTAPCTYTAYGLRIACDKPVFEFEPEQGSGTPDVAIRWRGERTSSPNSREKDWHFQAGPDQATLWVKGIGTFRIPDSATIDVAPERGADERMVERYLSGVVMAVLLHLRGLVVYHAGSVALNDREAIALVGDSGAGKSTLAALLHLRGFSCLADDVAGIRVEGDHISVVPAYPKLKISLGLARQQQVPGEDLSPVHSSEEEVYLSLVQGFPHRPLTLRALFFIGVDTRLSLRPLTAREAMIATVRQTLPFRLLQTVGDSGHFRKCSAIAGNVPAYLVTRTDDISCQDQMADMVATELLGRLGQPPS